jgi:hypothetical protein
LTFEVDKRPEVVEVKLKDEEVASSGNGSGAVDHGGTEFQEVK